MHEAELGQFRDARRSVSLYTHAVVLSLAVVVMLGVTAAFWIDRSATVVFRVFVTAPTLGVLAYLGGPLLRALHRSRRLRKAWSRAATGIPTRTLSGRAVRSRRTVNGQTMRTVVVDLDGTDRYVHLFLPASASDEALLPGPITLDLFADDGDVSGTARLGQGETTLWASSSMTPDPLRTARTGAAAGRLGDVNQDKVVWEGDDGWTPLTLPEDAADNG